MLILIKSWQEYIKGNQILNTLHPSSGVICTNDSNIPTGGDSERYVIVMFITRGQSLPCIPCKDGHTRDQKFHLCLRLRGSDLFSCARRISLVESMFPIKKGNRKQEKGKRQALWVLIITECNKCQLTIKIFVVSRYEKFQ